MTDLHLSPLFYTQVGVTAPKTMKVLPQTKKGTQKVTIGDISGVLMCFGAKKGDVNIVFKTLPGQKISRLELGGAQGTIKEKIFISSGSEVRGYSRKGKQFLAFETNSTEAVNSMFVDGNDLFTCGNYTYNHYRDCKDTNYYLASDKINDVISLPSKDPTSVISVIACQDCTLRLLKDSELAYEVEVAGPPLCVALYNGDGGSEQDEVLYGTQNGKMGLIKLGSTEPTYRWDLINERKLGGISCISTFDMTGEGNQDILVGRDDGTVEVYSLDDSGEPRLKASHCFNESISSICGGYISSADHEEIIVATFNGRIMGLTTEGRPRHSNTSSISQENQSKIDTLKEEIAGLTTQVDAANKKYQELSQAAQKGVNVLSALPEFPINDKFVLNQDEAWYTLSIETQVPIDTVLLQSNTPIDLQEVESSTAIVSYSPPDPDQGCYLLATYRCQDTTRLEVKIRSIEGQHGTLLAYVIPHMEPKTCRLRQYKIKPLSLHQRVHSFSEDKPCNSLKITGSFSLGEAHSWIVHCLPDVPDRPPVDSDESVTLYFRSTFVSTQLECSYKKGIAIFRSDNMSTISVLKDVLSKEVTQRKITVQMSHELDSNSIPHMLELIFPKLEDQVMLAKNVQLIDALQELQVHEEDLSFLSPHCQFILENAEMMKEDFKQQPCMVDRLYAIITDLYMDRANFKGVNMRHKVPELLEILDSCNLSNLLEFFKS
ncbi:Bardet-Biedl syndrome 7 protein homolog [Dysidea avara]|uniref:Bardet-Biedl syndrome 7 protein homolog n=1 Tax=Dysidea avara TaxID=196820 RepID=UPI003333AD21